ncbi:MULTISPECIES: hypothetical protein [Leeuwenhoekiella]|uniref:hypothetical protein n=1 Tax=Leeuwenhoekiella TaxID=283735 RepID=UPI00300BDC34|tara:strand:- start:1917 stop:2867 length:951 start_codon:yes stop_codon:yes gene_type:complete
MKNKISIIFLIFCVSISVYAQNTFPTSGSVGIGTTNPSSRLHLANLGSNEGIQFDSKFLMRTSSLSNNHFVFDNLTSNGSIYFRSGGGIGNIILNDSGGKVGIGTTSPSERLDVNGKATINNTLIINGVDSGNPNASNDQLRVSGYGILGNRGALYISNSNTLGSINFFVGGQHGSGSHLMIKNTGYIGIGTTIPDEKLTVKGNVHAEEVRVDLSVPGPDYVFEKTYDLRTLEEIQTYIETNKHLPEVPSASEFERDGISVGEMNMLLLKKVEELTLYIIQQHKESQSQSEMLLLQSKEINKLQLELKNIKSLMGR